MPQALIFGINGQDGYYLSQILTEKGISVTGVSRSATEWLQGDVGDRSFVTELIKKEKPDYIFHLAANSRINHELLFEHQSTIVNGTLNILEAVWQYSPSSRVFITGSGFQFLNTGNPINEETIFSPNNVYSLARIQSVYAARYYRTKGLMVYIGYLFHHDSPYRSHGHLNKKIVDAAKSAAAGKKISIEIGDIAVEKEFGYAADIAAGIWHLIQQNEIYEACLGTGKAYKIERWLDLCFSIVGKDWKEYVKLKSDYTPDFRRMLSDPSLINRSGWKAAVDITDLAHIMMASTF